MITFEAYHEFHKDAKALTLFDQEYADLGWWDKEYVNDVLGGEYIEASLAMGKFGFKFQPYEPNTK